MTRLRKIKRSYFNAAFVIYLLGGLLANHSWAAGLGLIEGALDAISGMGTSTVTVGGNMDNTCTVGGSSICVGSYVWTDDHSADASTNKGAIVMSGNVQQNLVSNINVNTTQSPSASGANVIGDVNIPAGGSINLSNNNNATGFIGGF